MEALRETEEEHRTQKELMLNQIVEQTKFAAEMTDQLLRSRLDSFQAFVLKMNLDTYTNALFTELKTLMVKFANVFGEAHLGIVLAQEASSLDGMSLHQRQSYLKKLQEFVGHQGRRCSSVKGACWIWTTATTHFQTASNVKELMAAWYVFKEAIEQVWHYLQPATGQQFALIWDGGEDLEQGDRGTDIGEQRRVDDQAKCGVSWFWCVCFAGPRPKCRPFERHESEECTLYKLHFCGLFSIEVLSLVHQFLMVCLLMDAIAACIAASTPPIMSLLLLLVNAFCILCMLLTHDQVNKFAKEKARLKRVLLELNKIRECNRLLGQGGQTAQAFQDIFKYRVLPLLDVMGKIASIIVQNDRAHEAAEDIFVLVNKAILALDNALSMGAVQVGDPVRVLATGRVGKVESVDEGTDPNCRVAFDDEVDPRHEVLKSVEVEKITKGWRAEEFRLEPAYKAPGGYGESLRKFAKMSSLDTYRLLSESQKQAQLVELIAMLEVGAASAKTFAPVLISIEGGS